ncbi:TlpA disulfide reductase family protein [Mucilaginibacter sp.]|uniref:TlpA disulfide reductase family protein n=1 Tax=Mucilaginibacter sp. TaxID=1882438 RepID=UPI002ECFBBBD
MKKYSVAALLSVLPFIALAQQNYTIRVKLKYVGPEAKAYLNYMKDKKIYQDSATLVNNQFVFKGSQNSQMKAYVVLSHNGRSIEGDQDADKVAVYLETGTVIVDANDSLKNAKVSGTRLNDDQQKVVDMLAPFETGRKTMVAAYEKADGDADEQEKIKADYAGLEQQKATAIEAFIKAHPNSLVSINLLLTNIDPAKDMAKARALFALLTPEVQNSKNGLVYKGVTTEPQSVEIGSPAPDFKLKNTKDEVVSLSSLKGKYVLIDFWASWCVPCRNENPNVVKAYEKYKAKNFTILGVSLDGGTNGKEKWMAAIAKDGLQWEQVSDLQGWQSPTALQYKVTEIPANFLIDPTGKIIARNLHGAELEQKLQSLL